MIRVGVIGAGGHAKGHVEGFAALPHSEVVWVADPVLDRATELAGPVGARAISDGLSALEDVDAVVIASPNPFHHDQLRAVAAAGRHVYCEKPFGLSLAEAQSMHDAIMAARVTCQTGFAVSFDPITRTMIDTAQMLELGDLVSITSRRMFHMPKTGGWRDDPAQTGGVLFEINIHELEWMMRVGGPVVKVQSRRWAESDHPRANDHIWFQLEFASGAVGQHEGGWRAPMAQFFRAVQGTEAGMSTDEWGSKLYHARIGEDRAEIEPGERFDPRADFIDAIRFHREPVASSAWSLEVAKVAEAIVDGWAG